MLDCLGYRTMQHVLTGKEKFCFGAVFMVMYILAHLIVTLFCLCLKYIAKRQKPAYKFDLKRHGCPSLLDRSKYSMPCEDSATSALFCFLCCTVVYLPLMYLILPLVILGRVFYQCSNFCDTFVGVIIGTLVGVVVYT